MNRSPASSVGTNRPENRTFRQTLQPERLHVAQLKKGTGLLLFLLFTGTVLGSVLTLIFNAFLPSGPMARIFLSSVSIGSATPATFHLVLLDISLGLALHINLLNILGLFLGYYIYRNS